jgi:hypothetical protein
MDAGRSTDRHQAQAVIEDESRRVRTSREEIVERVLKPWGRKVPGSGNPGSTGPVALACVEGEKNPRVSLCLVAQQRKLPER